MNNRKPTNKPHILTKKLAPVVALLDERPPTGPEFTELAAWCARRMSGTQLQAAARLLVLYVCGTLPK
ncbi:MAG: hypothetical protein ACM3SS_19675 [Rhodospirillaceae bacterium]